MSAAVAVTARSGHRGLIATLRYRLVRSRSAQVGAVCIAAVASFALIAPFFTLSPYDQTLVDRLTPPLFTAEGNPAYFLGTDQLGRDIVARLATGARLSLLIALLAVSLSGALGVLVGLYAGFYGGRVDRLIMRLADIQLAFPLILFVILIVGALGPGVRNLIVILGVSGWVVYARVVRAEVLRLRNQEFVLAARSVGDRERAILFRHILPNTLAPVIVIATSAMAQMIISEAALSFLGLGVQSPEASLGTMLSDGREYLTINPWLATIPGVTITVSVLGINLLGDWLRDALDPRMVR